MRTNSLIKLSWKNLWAHRFRAFLTVGGVTIGMAAIVFLVSIGFGLEQLVTNRVADFEAFTIIDVPSANLKTGKINKDAIKRIQEIGHIVSVDEVADMAGRVRLANQNSTTETVVDGVTSNFFKLTGLPLESGKLFSNEKINEAVINKTLAGLLGYSDHPEALVGQSVILDAIIAKDLRSSDAIDGPIVKPDIELKVVGLTNDNPNPVIYTPLGLAEKSGAVNRSSLKIKVDDRKIVPQVRKAIENNGFSTEYVGDTVQQIAQFFSLFRLLLAGFGLVALLVAALGTFNVLTISLLERIREVGLLKTLGMQRSDIFRLFLIESLTIGILGGILGLGVGNGIGWLLNRFLYYLAVKAASDPVSIYYLPTSFIWVVAGVSVLVSFLTGFYPARRAVKISPLDVLRYE